MKLKGVKIRMGFLEALTIVFIILKLIGIISWSWWLVLLPLFVSLGIYTLILAFIIIGMIFGD